MGGEGGAWHVRAHEYTRGDVLSVSVYVRVSGGPGPGSVLEVEAAECAHCSTSSCCISRNTYWIYNLVWEAVCMYSVYMFSECVYA